jgi:hypothetical protein
VERGTNSRADLVRKIASYNALFARTDMWRRVFGRFPRILVVVPEEAQVRVQAHTWRRHYRVNVPTSVLVTSLERLALAYYDYAISYGVTGGRVLLNYPLWLDVMSISTGSPATNDYWLPLGRALTLDRLLS